MIRLLISKLVFLRHTFTYKSLWHKGWRRIGWRVACFFVYVDALYRCVPVLLNSLLNQAVWIAREPVSWLSLWCVVSLLNIVFQFIDNTTLVMVPDREYEHLNRNLSPHPQPIPHARYTECGGWVWVVPIVSLLCKVATWLSRWNPEFASLASCWKRLTCSLLNSVSDLGLY